MASKNLYDYTSFFQLLIDGIAYPINEPLGWDKITLSVPRDKESFAFNFEFVDDSVQLEFADDDISYNLIKDVYELKGSDGVVIFQYGYYPVGSSVKSVKMTGNVNLNTYLNQDGSIKCSVAKVSFENLARTRYETPVDLSATATMDSESMVHATPYTIKLHSKKISKQFKAVTDEPKSASSGAIARFFQVQLDSSDVVTGEVEENQSLPLGISGNDPRDEDRYFFKILEDGDYTLKVQAAFTLHIIRPGVSSVGDWNVVPRLMVQRAGVTIDYYDANPFRQLGSSGSSDATLYFNFSFEVDRPWLTDDRLYLDVNGVMEFAGVTYIYEVANYTSTIQILAETTAPETTTKGYRLFDAVNKMLESITGQPNSLISSILGAGGALYKTFLTNGYAIRNFTTSDKPVIAKLQDVIDSLAAISGLGYGYKNVAGKDYFIIEPLSYFFKNMPITEVQNIFDFKEEHAKDLVYNEIDIGYEKYSEEELNTLDEFNTYQTSLTPIKTYKSKFTKKSKLITSGYSLEKQRREQFAENPSESLSDDDELFLISCNESYTYFANDYVTYPVTHQIKFNREMNLANGTAIRIFGGDNGSNNNKSFTITGKDSSSETYTVTGTLLFDTGNVLVRRNATGVQAEKDEYFPIVTGLFSPETAYNLRFSPKRMLYNWARYLNIGFNKKSDTEIIKNTFVKNNDKMISMLSVLDTTRRDEPLYPFGEADDITLDEFRTGKDALHLPLYCTFSADMDYDAFLYIKDRIMGESATSKDYGYIYFKDPDAVMIKAFVYELKYKPAEEVAEFVVAKIGIY